MSQEVDTTVILHDRYRGYSHCEVTGEKYGLQWELRVIGSGELIYRYEDEFDFE